MNPRSRDERTGTSDEHRAGRHDELFRTPNGLYVLVDVTAPSTQWIRTDRLVNVTP
jgi:hypothetical protein